jgi:rhodanese-related sulfurtransferase
MTIKNLDPRVVAGLLKQDAILLIDVREPGEFATAHIKGAHLVPLSTFDPHSLPDPAGRTIVFHCGVGGRSAKAVAACQAAGLSIDSHMKGGIQAWIGTGLPVER